MALNSIAYYTKSALILLGAIVLFGHIVQQPVLVQIFPGMIGMVPNTALNFILLGIALYLSTQLTLIPSILRITLLLIITILSVMSLSEDIFQCDLGIDSWMATDWLKDPNPTPGRMAPNTSVCFLLSVLVTILIPYGNKKVFGIIVQLATLLILFIALFSLFVYWMKWEFIFNWYRFARMASHTAIGFILTSVALGATWLQTWWYKKFYKGIEDKKIMLITAIILLFVNLMCGLGSIAGLTSINIRTVQRSIESILKNKVNEFIETTKNIQQEINYLVIKESTSNVSTMDKASNEFINKYLIDKGFNALQIQNQNKKIVFSNGTLRQKPQIEVLLNQPHKSTLIWDDGFWYKVEIPLYREPDHILKGYLIAEKFLSALSQHYQNYEGLGKTGEIMMCAKYREYFAECFPSRFTNEKYILRLINNSTPLAVSYAFQGLSGTINTIDYKGNKVIAAYTPIGDLGLGLVIKLQSTEIYSPIRQQLKMIIPLGLILVFFGLFLLYWQVAPLVRKAINSEKEAQKSKVDALHLNNELSKRNKEIQLMRELSSTLQSALSLDEAFEIVVQYGKKLLPDDAVIFFLMHASHNYLEAKFGWGNPKLDEKILKPEDCWALRKGALHKVHDSETSLLCPHSKGLGDKSPPYICIPMLAQNDIIGLLYVEIDTSNVSEKHHTELLNLAVTFSEQISLSIANTKLRESLRNQAISDKLTGLYNRRYLEETMERELNRIKRAESTLALLMIDIDHFKHFNDTFGHEAGDVVLKALGQSLLHYTRASDISCRFGGEEFTVVLLDISLDDAIVRAQEIHTLMSQLHLRYQDAPLGPVTLSIGIAMYPEHGTSLEELIHHADAALYQAKNQGRNRTVVFNEESTG